MHRLLAYRRQALEGVGGVIENGSGRDESDQALLPM